MRTIIDVPPSFVNTIIIVLAVATALLFGCDTNDTQPERDDAITLNLETLEAETEFGTLEAERVDASYVTAIGDEQSIGIVLLDGPDGSETGAEQEVLVSLYDRNDLAVLRGELDSTGEATLESVDASDFDATIALAIEEDVATGTLNGPEEEPTPFTAEAAVGIGGVYRAEGTEKDPDVGGSWVVLPDERQWGCVCHPPFRSPCCTLQF